MWVGGWMVGGGGGMGGVTLGNLASPLICKNHEL